MSKAPERIKLMVTVKAYPVISKKHGEAVCVAGIRIDTDPRWVRLWPIRFRDLPFDRKFKKYQVVSLEASKATDQRPESMRPVEDSLQLLEIIDSKNQWAKRRTYIDPLVVDSMCWIHRQQKIDGTSLGVFRPAEILDFDSEQLPSDWDPEKQAIIDQPSMFMPTKTGLEKVPYRFRYRYRCVDKSCPGHYQSIVDWEVGAAFRKFRDTYSSEQEALEKLRERWFDINCGPDKDVHFYVGNMHLHQDNFIVLGVVYPKK